jgi:Cu/Ag efflux protein CusF
MATEGITVPGEWGFVESCGEQVRSFAHFSKVPLREVEMKRLAMMGALFWLLLACGYAQQGKNDAAPKKEHVFKGKVEKIDTANKTFTVNGQKVEGWMDAMTMSYVPDKEDVLKKVKVGDEITAKVYDGDFRTLHDVQVIPAKPTDTKAAPAEKKDGKAGKK